MKAILVHQPGGPEELYIGEAPVPELGEEEIRVKVKATAVNRADVLQRKGMYPPPPGESNIIGLEMAGEVAEVGAKVKNWKKGDRVFALLAGGGCAEYVVVDEQVAMPIPENLSYEEAAGIAEVFLTAYQSLIWIGQLEEKQDVLIHAGASGVGTAAIQIAKWKQARVFVTISTEKKSSACQNLGADIPINYRESDFAAKVLEATAGKGVDVLIDFIGAAYMKQNLNCLALDGHMVMLALMGGHKVENFPIGKLLQKRLTLTGTTLRNRSLAYKRKLSQEFTSVCLPKFETGDFKPVIDQIMPWGEVKAAHQHMESNQHIGKIVLRVEI
ncbi:MAG: NAD(P)H-quinone oxidoreductase [SAR324 cluster bacterium]|nr:NAD(P)H-quinone oxidoreductase [SAR324 cluster bacterium]